jgi:aspartate kinase
MGTLVMKFGGTTVGTTMALTQMASIVMTERERWNQLLLVVSALDGVTDQLLEAAHLAEIEQRRGYRRIVANLRTRHLALVEHLLNPAERTTLLTNIDGLLSELLNQCEALAEHRLTATPDVLDAISTLGERLAARIVAALLRQNGLRSVAIDTTEIIITDDAHGHATPDMALTRQRIDSQLVPMLGRSIVPVLTGFIGATAKGKPTTLGRGGSDYSASILAASIDADEVWMWTDVDGMMTADPLDVANAELIPWLSYTEAADLAYFGARVLQPRMINLLHERRIPLRLRNLFAPQKPGTLISQTANAPQSSAIAVTSIAGIGLSRSSGGSLASLASLVDEVFYAYSSIHADVMLATQATSASVVCFIVPTTAGQDAVHRLADALASRLATLPSSQAWTVQTVVVVTATGVLLEQDPSLYTRLLAAITSVPFLSTHTHPARASLSVVLEPQYAETMLRRIHEIIVG